MPQFCSQHSLDADEPLAGTGVHARTNLLLSWPIGGWTRTFHQAKDMTDAVSQRVKDLVEQGRRVNLMHRPDQPGDWHRAYLMPERQAFAIPHDELEAFLRALQQEQDIQRWATGEVEHKVVLCCTHGIKDRCCAKFGHIGFKALDAAAKAYDGAFEIWQSTHLGGCRLASAALVFPDMNKYGRIDPEQADALLASESNNRPYLPNYRGDGALSPIQQIADVEARRRLAEQGVYPDRVEILSEQAHHEHQARVDVQWVTNDDQGTLGIQLEATTVFRHGTCADLDAGDVPAAHSTWVPVATRGVQSFKPSAA